jgi:hypothetical protein
VHAGFGTEVNVRGGEFDRECQNPHALPTPQRVPHPQKISLRLGGVNGSTHQWVRSDSELAAEKQVNDCEQMHRGSKPAPFANPAKSAAPAKMWAWSSYRFYQYGERSLCTPDTEPK